MSRRAVGRKYAAKAARRSALSFNWAKSKAKVLERLREASLIGDIEAGNTTPQIVAGIAWRYISPNAEDLSECDRARFNLGRDLKGIRSNVGRAIRDISGIVIPALKVTAFLPLSVTDARSGERHTLGDLPALVRNLKALDTVLAGFAPYRIQPNKKNRDTRKLAAMLSYLNLFLSANSRIRGEPGPARSLSRRICAALAFTHKDADLSPQYAATLIKRHDGSPSRRR